MFREALMQAYYKSWSQSHRKYCRLDPAGINISLTTTYSEEALPESWPTCSIALRCASEGGSMCTPFTFVKIEAPPGSPPRVCLSALSWVATM